MRSLVCLLTFAVPSLAQAGADEGFVPLFNGKNLDGWEVRERQPGDKDKWSAKASILTAMPGSGWIGTTKMYGDFVLRLEWRIPENGNSGVFIRVPDVKTKVSPSGLGMEIQVLDDTGPEYKGKLKDWQYSGSIYGFVPPSKSMYKGAGAWNRYEITCMGNLVTVVFNGEKVVEGDMSKFPELDKRPRRGFIGLQNHSTGVEYRNVRIKVLDTK
jgi:Domain of Unknown Function (DUF1080)